ncbi:MAG: hypothetical protein P8Y36_11235, partial [Alphaproteobacteria bacterium]
VSGGNVFEIDGTEHTAKRRYAYHFEAATASPDGRFAVIYERLGTKGLLLEDGKILRELNRSFYHAEAYEYPVALFYEPDGRLLLAHCPADYNRIELEEVETGQVLTALPNRDPPDFFHSRLRASPNGQRLLSAGWVWHPWSAVACFDVARALADPCHLDNLDSVSPYSQHVGLTEETSACWLDDDTIVLGASNEPESPEERHEAGAEPRLRPCGVAVYDLTNGATCRGAFQLDEQPGTLLAVGPHHILSLYRHPKLIDLANGRILHVWRELRSGLQDGSILWGLNEETRPPPMAFDSTNHRFAIANGDAVIIIEFNLSAFSSA